MKIFLNLLFISIFGLLLYQSILASIDKNVITAGAQIWGMPWGKATLMDAYFGFLTFYVWLCFKENSLVKCLLWFIGLMLLGNFAMSAYMLWQLKKLEPEQPWHDIFKRI